MEVTDLTTAAGARPLASARAPGVPWSELDDHERGDHHDYAHHAGRGEQERPLRRLRMRMQALGPVTLLGAALLARLRFGQRRLLRSSSPTD